jgi:penicillin amidase
MRQTLIPGDNMKNILAASLMAALAFTSVNAETIAVPKALADTVTVTYDADGVAYIEADNELDAAFAQGYVQARDRFFAMDLTRRQASGTLAELLGEGALSSDIQLRTLGLRRSAYESWFEMGEETRGWLKAFADGVNAYLASGAPLNPAYAALELTEPEPWTPVDSIVVGKALAFQLSFDLDIDRTVNLGTYQAVGDAVGFDGTALFFNDTHRSAPADDRISMPEFADSIGIISPGNKSEGNNRPTLDPELIQLASNYADMVRDLPMLGETLEPRLDGRGGSNLWAIDGSLTDSGDPLVANDPHLSLGLPSVFMEAHVSIAGANAFGASVPGTPGIIQGCTDVYCWGSTVHPVDVTDTYQETLVLNTYGLPSHTVYQGEQEPLTYVFQSYYVNQVGDGVTDNVTRANVGYGNGGITFLVPRRGNGPILALDGNTGLSVQYTGWGPTQELEAFRRINVGDSMADFREGLTFFDFGSQNFVYADIEGNIAHFTALETPLRADLQQDLAPDGGIPPYLIRNGNGTLNHEWLPVTEPQSNQSTPYQLLPIEELPTQINPARGFVANANNDNVGTTLDNNPVNQLRPGGNGIYYLDAGYSVYRMGRLDREIKAQVAAGEAFTIDDMKRLQANNQMLDAELLMPFLANAWQRALVARDEGSAPALISLGNDPMLAEAMDYLMDWDFSTPTGLAEGYDPFEDPNNLSAPTEAEINASVAATLYSVWRGQAIRRIIDEPLQAVGIPADNLPPGSLALSAMVYHLRAFPQLQGVGASGVDFFPLAGVADLSREDARDVALLGALTETLQRLAGEPFQAAFAGSTNLQDYRWGKLHRITFRHPLGGPFNIPNNAGFASVSDELPGVARHGGFDVLDASSHNVRADSAQDFTFSSGASRRFVARMTPEGIQAEQIIPFGQTDNPFDPGYGNQIGRWLTNDYRDLLPSAAFLPAERSNNTLQLVPSQ